MEDRSARLKKIRLERGLTLEDMQKKTKIHLNILQAIEGDSLTNLSPVYLRGFIKIYCRALGIDPREFISGDQETQGHGQGESGAPEGISRAEEKSGHPVFLKSASSKLGSLQPNRKIKFVAGLVILVVILSLGVLKLGKVISSQSKARVRVARVTPQKTEKPRYNIPPKADKAKAAAVVQPAQPRQRKEVSSEIRLVVLAKENCWLTVKVDGRLVFQRILEKGRSETWKAKDKMELSVSNAAAVELQVNGERFVNLGRKGQVLKNILITPKEGLRIIK